MINLFSQKRRVGVCEHTEHARKPSIFPRIIEKILINLRYFLIISDITILPNKKRRDFSSLRDECQPIKPDQGSRNNIRVAWTMGKSEFSSGVEGGKNDIDFCPLERDSRRSLNFSRVGMASKKPTRPIKLIA